MMKPIDIKTFRHLLSVHGTDLSRWPDIDVKNVLAFIEDNTDAKAEFEQAGALDDALALYAVPAFDADRLMARIENEDSAEHMTSDDADIPAHIAAGANRAAGASHRSFWRAGIAFTACAVLMVVGVTSLYKPTSSNNVTVVTAKTAAAEDIDSQIDDLLVIAANGYQEQAQIQELMNILGRDENTSAAEQDSDVREDMDDAVNQWLEREFNSLEGQEFLRDYVTDNG